MDGIEKITGKIAEDVQREIDALSAEAGRQADEISARYAAEARRESEEILARGRKNAAERLERLGSVAGLEARKLELAAKQEMLERTFQRALDDLVNLPEHEYVALLAKLAVSAAVTGQETVILSPKDRARFGKQVVTQANEMLAKAAALKLPEELSESKAGALLGRVVAGASALLTGTGMLTLSEQTRPMRGGLILSDGEVEINCTFETLVRLQRGSLEREVAGVLFD